MFDIIVEQWMHLLELYKQMELFSNFKFIFELLDDNRQNIQTNGVNIDQSAMCCISMDLS